jgi:hypothetical protein
MKLWVEIDFRTMQLDFLELVYKHFSNSTLAYFYSYFFLNIFVNSATHVGYMAVRFNLIIKLKKKLFFHMKP